MRFKVTTKTPVHIGDGEQLSPYCDFIVKDNRVHYIDHDKFEGFLYTHSGYEDIIDDFVEIIKKQANTNLTKKYKLVDLFEKYGLDVEEFVENSIELMADLKNQTIQRTIRTGNRPYIPGSSVKGAIRTALLFDYFSKNKDKLDTKLKKNTYIGEDVFGRFLEDELKFLYVSDSTPVEAENIGIAKTISVHINKEKSGIPINKEVIREGTTTNISIKTKAKKDYHDIVYDKKEKVEKNKKIKEYLFKGAEEEIIDKINSFAIKILEKEILQLKNTKVDKFDSIITLYNELKELAENYRKNRNGAILRIGSGKTFFDDTISILFNKEELDFIRKKRNLGTHKPFPITRSVVEQDGKLNTVLGWIQLDRID